MNTRNGWMNAGALLILLGAGLSGIAACSRGSGEVQLLPETREGMFYLRFAEAQEAARTEGKHLLVDFWRPG